jgi:hypothetical protein
METLASTPAANRNSALSALSLFFDIAVGLAGPVMGLVASGLGYAAISLCCVDVDGRVCGGALPMQE